MAGGWGDNTGPLFGQKCPKSDNAPRGLGLRLVVPEKLAHGAFGCGGETAEGGEISVKATLRMGTLRPPVLAYKGRLSLGVELIGFRKVCQCDDAPFA